MRGAFLCGEAYEHRKDWIETRLEELVRRKVASGLYNSSSEVVREALRLLEEHDRIKEIKLEELRKEIQKGMDSLDRGEGTAIDADDVIKRGRERLAARQENS